MRIVAAAIVTVLTSAPSSEACAQTQSGAPASSPRDYAVGSSSEALRRFHRCTTSMSYMMIHGTQITYLRPDGAIFLWYPGNSVVLQGQWEARHGSICFRYPANSYNPATRTPGGTWNCMLSHAIAGSTVEMVRGDLFGLARRTAVPFVLPGVKTTFAELREFAALLAPEARPPKIPDKGCDIPRTK